ncbi:o-succinylbenzoate synthase [Smaragdicoccus niigatensis]|uniref:o-succinylbenzoate synthase n=1 Tax=Smaragdicoccus niigatensis TaxID=359359 RepID=UPI00037691E5|nr:o-succinylbenzoate synthase [Smaragdicoccus niigatensis]
MLPPLKDVLEGLRVVELPLAVPFRGITAREVALIEGPLGWGEFAPFVEYETEEAKHWLRSAVDYAWAPTPAGLRTSIPVNATVPAVDATDVPAVLARFPGAKTAKVKVAERGQSLADDVRRVRAVREFVPNVRVDANGGWSVDEAVNALSAFGALEYAEQPCATVEELSELRRRLPDVQIAADESIRKASDPLRVAHAGACDVAVLKVAPLGGVNATVSIARQLDDLGIPVVISSAIDSVIGISAGLATAAALPRLPFACGLATGELLVADVGERIRWQNGELMVERRIPSPELLVKFAASADRAIWWRDRVSRCWGALNL